MIKLLCQLPHVITVAVSGGSDSMGLLDFLHRKHTVNAVFINHGTKHSAEAERFVGDFCSGRRIPFVAHTISMEKPKGESQEEWWRNQRYRVFHGLDATVVTAHQLDDCIEQWLFSSIHGKGNTIPYANRNVVRPVLTTTKEELRSWCIRRNVPWIEDPSNRDIKYMRNLIRHELMPSILKINPGICKVVRKKVLKAMEDSALT
jgi:tRNA(Ile)-lysidine synthase